jgi:hypothetical protein
MRRHLQPKVRVYEISRIDEIRAANGPQFEFAGASQVGLPGCGWIIPGLRMRSLHPEGNVILLRFDRRIAALPDCIQACRARLQVCSLDWAQTR